MTCPACNQPYGAKVWCPHNVDVYSVYYGVIRMVHCTLIYIPNTLNPVVFYKHKVLDTVEKIEKLLVLI
jgi:hypothetical protein